MKILFIGGTGNISLETSRLAVEMGFELTILNRGKSNEEVRGARFITADIHKPQQVRNMLVNEYFDAVVNWIAYDPHDIERDLELFKQHTRQYIFISSASVYQKPPTHAVITESTPAYNPYWVYSQKKIACENRLLQAYHEERFPVTIVRPSHTYDHFIPSAIGGSDFTVVNRMLCGLPVIVHGDGSSLWTLTHAIDFARGFNGLLGNPNTIGHIFHITSDETLNWNQVYEIIGDAAGVKPKIVHIPSDFVARVDPEIGAGLLGDKTWSAVFDNSKIKRFIPGFQATIPFFRGIRRTLDWFNADPARQVINENANAAIERILTAYQN